MKLVYKGTDDLVHIGDSVTLSDGQNVEVTYFRPPHSASSSGKVTVKVPGNDTDFGREYFVGIIGAEWILREDRGEI